MIYELWHVDGGNIIGAWEHEGEALALVRANLQTHGPESVESWVLLCGDPDGGLTTIAEGSALAERARAALSVA